MLKEFVNKILVKENILKFLLFIIIIYLTWKCFNMKEFFADSLNNKKITFTANGNKYTIISFDELKPEYQDKIISQLSQNNEFINLKESVDDIKNKIFYKTPLYLVKESDVNKYVNNNTLTFNLINDGKINNKDIYAFKPVINNETKGDKYLVYNPSFDFMYYSKAGNFFKSYIDGMIENKYLKENVVPNEDLHGISNKGTVLLNLSIN